MIKDSKYIKLNTASSKRQISMLSHYFYKELLRCSLVASFCKKVFKNFAFVINSAPKVKSLAVYFDEDLV